MFWYKRDFAKARVLKEGTLGDRRRLRYKFLGEIRRDRVEEQ